MEQALASLLVSISDSPKGDPVDIMRINHHGSNSSSSETYLKQLKPEVAILSLGDGNQYGHPKQKVIDRLNNIFPKPLKHIYLTEEGESGRNYYSLPHDFMYEAVIVSTNGTRYSINNTQGGYDNYTVDCRNRKTNIAPILQLLLNN
jgi:hypothetical protein